MSDNLKELGNFLRTKRESLSPSDFGLHATRRRTKDQFATFRPNYKKNGIFPFPANIWRHGRSTAEKDFWEISFPDLEKYGLNITVLDVGKERTLIRAENTINLILAATDKKIEYPDKKEEQIEVRLNFDVTHKHFLKEFKVYMRELAEKEQNNEL